MRGGKVFISYRREDPSAYAGWVRDRLEAGLPYCVFFDVHNIERGEFFDERLRSEARRCRAMIAVINKDWVTTAKEGMRRLDDPKDWVRIEIGTALSSSAKVIPLLVNGAAALNADDLPEDLKSLARCDAVFVDNSRFEDEIEKLVPLLRKELGWRYWLGLVRAFFSRRAWFAGYALLAAMAVLGAVLIRPAAPNLATAPWIDNFDTAGPVDPAKWNRPPASWAYATTADQTERTLVSKDLPAWILMSKNRVFKDAELDFQLLVTEGQKSAAWAWRGTDRKHYYLFRIRFPEGGAKATIEAFAEPGHRALQLPDQTQLPLVFDRQFPPGTRVMVKLTARGFEFAYTITVADPRAFDNPPDLIPAVPQPVTFSDGRSQYPQGTFGLLPEPLTTLVEMLKIEPL